MTTNSDETMTRLRDQIDAHEPAAPGDRVHEQEPELVSRFADRIDHDVRCAISRFGALARLDDGGILAAKFQASGWTEIRELQGHLRAGAAAARDAAAELDRIVGKLDVLAELV